MPGTKKASTRKSANASAPNAASGTFAELQVVLGRPDEYERAKRLLNQGRHPAFIGRGTVQRNAIQGGLLFAQVHGQDAAVALIGIRNGTLLVLNVLPAHRGAGLGRKFVEFLRPNFARVVESAVPFFEGCGYKSIGKSKQGRTLKTQIMVRSELIGLAGRLQQTHGDHCPCAHDAGPSGHDETVAC
jgi:GNAT superfamily N-acetyltransferase